MGESKGGSMEWSKGLSKGESKKEVRQGVRQGVREGVRERVREIVRKGVRPGWCLPYICLVQESTIFIITWIYKHHILSYLILLQVRGGATVIL